MAAPTNEFASSGLVLASGTGTNYSAVIPGLAAGAALQYYVLSSTAANPGALTHATADALT